MRMLEVPEYALYEIHESGERRISENEKPLLVQLSWHHDDREGRFLLRRIDEASLIPKPTQEDSSFKRKLSKREKKELKKQEKKEKVKDGKADESMGNNLYTGRRDLLIIVDNWDFSSLMWILEHICNRYIFIRQKRGFLSVVQITQDWWSLGFYLFASVVCKQGGRRSEIFSQLVTRHEILHLNINHVPETKLCTDLVPSQQQADINLFCFRQEWI